MGEGETGLRTRSRQRFKETVALQEEIAVSLTMFDGGWFGHRDRSSEGKTAGTRSTRWSSSVEGADAKIHLSVLQKKTVGVTRLSSRLANRTFLT
jgi:hypothetical protein